MSNDLIVKSESNNVMQMISTLMDNEHFDASKLEKMQEMFFKAQDREKQAAFMRDFVAAQGAMPAIMKRGFNSHTKSKYAKIDDIIEGISPVMEQFGFAMTFGTFQSAIEGHVGVSARLVHREGHFESYAYDSPFDNKGINGSVNKTNPHAVGSALAYGQRYLTSMIWNLLLTERVIADDDGNSAGGHLIQKITEEQVATLDAMIEEIGVKKHLVLELWKVEKLSDLPASGFENCVQALERRRARVGL